MNYRKKVVLMLGVLSYLNLGTFSQAAPLTVDHTSVAGVQQASNDKKTIKISGSVRDAAGESIIGATILEKGTSNGVVSDMDGNFSMTVAANGILHISYIGYVDQDIAVAGKSLFNIQLLEDTEMLDEVVVIGYGTVKKSHLSGAVSSVGTKELNGDVATTAATALQGKIAGVTVMSSSGNPNDGTTINVRGISSLSNNAPLFVVDGAFGDINMVDPNDIQSIEVLKDAAAAAIYGSRAAGGVVLITTKGGRKEMPTKVDVNFFTGVQQNPKKLNVLNGEQYSRFASYYGMAADGYGSETDAIPFIGEGTDWQDVMLNTAMVYKANVSVTGGSKNASFSASGGYLNKDGIMRNSSHESYNIRLKSDFSFLNNRVTLGESLIIRLAEGKGFSV